MHHSLPPPAELRGFGARKRLRILPRYYVRAMHRLVDANPTTEHALYLHIFVTSSGGW
jgi:hypothetical protein